MYLQEEVVTYEVAKLASESGFKSFTRSYYMIGDKEPFFVGEAKNWNVHYDRYSAPTQSLLQKWLREKKGVCIAIYPNLRVNHFFEWIGYKKDEKCWTPIVSNMKEYSTYELALENALKYALENLVKI